MQAAFDAIDSDYPDTVERMKKFETALLLIAACILLFSTGSGFAQAAAPTAAPQSAPAAKPMQFFLKLIPPRRTFPSDMTEQESQLMTAHAAYWAGLFKAGKVLIIGPVMDPKGAWGMGVIEAASQAEAQQMAENDPSVKAGLNKVELSPMHVFLRKQ